VLETKQARSASLN
jgi:hypothetical protein